MWLKQNRKSPGWFYGLGFWTRGNAEICLLGVKGHPRRRSARVHQFIISPLEAHSKKPDETREKIVELMGDTIPDTLMPGPFQPQPEPADPRTDIQKRKPSHGQSTSPLFSLPLPSGSRTTLLSTSFPHASQPGIRCLANNSTLGRSPISSTIFSRVSSGFLLWEADAGRDPLCGCVVLWVPLL